MNVKEARGMDNETFISRCIPVASASDEDKAQVALGLMGKLKCIDCGHEFYTATYNANLNDRCKKCYGNEYGIKFECIK